jgi:hypothetical protein
MKSPNVCTAATTHGPIVSLNSEPPGPTAPSLDRFYSVLSPQSSVLIPPGASTSPRNSVQCPSAKTPQSFRLSFALFVLFVMFVVNPLLKSTFRNRLCSHETPVYRRLSRIIGFENFSFSQQSDPHSFRLTTSH